MTSVKMSGDAVEYVRAIAQIIKAFAWPAALAIIAILFRKPIRLLLESISEAKWSGAGLEVSIKRNLADTRRLVEQIPPQVEQAPEQLIQVPEQPAPPTPEPSDPVNELIQLAQFSPRAAIMEAWLRVEAAGSEFANKVRPPQSTTLHRRAHFVEVLRRSERVPSQIIRAIQNLREIRNKVAHESTYEPSIDDAEEYVLLSFAVIEDLTRLSQKF